ncbi:hypothetical protein [Runella slithyformis]|uniref:DUF4175 domain-containing protein n=1 Tax=Runella slithyformis (strain ATCC 29530 / DSM 19594 / LMG 11500 / NCIMB 11436 / LSU 4) TaxID=761193 RepID=A0A7U3ZPR8_RUNSL|nr:hypothetical protein [Runella slithyformis]AEI51110.1 hypothetical protein Runsl_4795 [Runella slithyformis DSM 19594]
MNHLHKIITWVSYQLYAGALLTSGLAAGSAFLMVSSVTASFMVSIAAALGVFAVSAYWTRLFQNKRTEAIRFIHQNLHDSEYSLQLLEAERPNIAERLQLERLAEKMQHQPPPRVFPARAGMLVAVFLMCLGVRFGLPLLSKNGITRTITKENKGRSIENLQLMPSFVSAKLTVTPPSYTKLPIREQTDLNASSISGAGLKWEVAFNDSEKVTVKLTNNRGEELAFTKAGDQFEYRDRLYSSGLYGIRAYWKDSLIYQSDYYRLEALPDLAPKIEPSSKELYQYHFLKDPKTIQISAGLSDDFLVSQAFIVATVARGSGENVKFREVKLPITQANFKETKIVKNIDLKALNFTPGDELYYYWAAIDNKRPEPNYSKSDTYFIVYKDTANVEESELATMAMNILPEYFRSQRQIIIDTEKLIAKRKKLSAKEFNGTSNEIGFDQKALRLRYGQYLGEEFENSIGGGNALPKDNQGDAVVGFALLHGFVHAHDTGEPGGESGGNSHEGHNHGGDGKKNTDEKDPVASILEEYVHSHDDGEANTFYEQSTRSLLKMALEQMWQSELHLRLYEPEKAIPFEKKALEYLKSAQHRARTFVKKTSYDPPPIKESEKRLTGELKNYNEAYRSEKVYSQQQVERLVAEVMGIIEESESKKLTVFQKQKMLELGNVLTSKGMNGRLSDWSILSSLQKLANDKTLSEREKKTLKTKLYDWVGRSLPAKENASPSSYSTNKTLEKAFWKNL